MFSPGKRDLSVQIELSLSLSPHILLLFFEISLARPERERPSKMFVQVCNFFLRSSSSSWSLDARDDDESVCFQLLFAVSRVVVVHMSVTRRPLGPKISTLCSPC